MWTGELSTEAIYNPTQGQREKDRRGGGAKYMGPGPVRGSVILIKHLVMGATDKRAGGR